MKQEVKLTFTKGQKITLFYISSFMAHTVRQEIEITGEVAGKTTFRQRGKRKEFYLSLDHDALVFNGWDLAIKADSDGGNFFGNACYNLVAESPEALKAILDTSLNPLTEETMAKVFFISMEAFRSGRHYSDTGVLLYPEAETYHAVVNQAKEHGNTFPANTVINPNLLH